MKRVCEESPRPIQELNGDVPQWLIQTIDRLLAKRPAERFQSAAEVADQPAPEPPAQEDPASLTAVILRLTDGTLLEVGKFPTVAEAAAEAQEVVIEIAAADRNGGWPFFAQRYLRPDLIVSVDLIEQGPVPADGLRRSQR